MALHLLDKNHKDGPKKGYRWEKVKSVDHPGNLCKRADFLVGFLRRGRLPMGKEAVPDSGKELEKQRGPFRGRWEKLA